MSKIVVGVFFSLIVVALAVTASVSTAFADISVGNGGNGRIPAQYRIIQAAGTMSLTGARVFMGVANLNTTAQLNAVTCYDNSTAASGPVIYSGAVGLAPPTFPSDGVSLISGLTCTVSLALLGQGVAIYYR